MDKIEILQKLIALANNNPNEHEANSAARRVCKLLVELKVNFKTRQASDKVPPSTSRQQHPWSHYPYTDPMGDILRAAEEAFRREKKERAERDRKEYERQAQEQVNKNQEFYERFKQGDYKNKWWKERPPFEAKIPRDYKVRTDQKDKYSSLEWESGIPIPNKDQFEFNPRTCEWVRVSKKKERNCTKCGREFKTAYIGNLFICNQCHWDEYNKRKEAK